MMKYVLTYGAISGSLVIGIAILSIQLAGDQHLAALEWLGYLVMIVALSAIFVGIKRYRDQELGGVIRFGTAFGLGLAMAVVAGVIYVVVWEVHLSWTDHAFIGDYTAGVIEESEARGITPAERDELVAEMAELETRYADPLFRLPMTFLEIFPVGLLITLIAASLLRNSRFLPAA